MNHQLIAAAVFMSILSASSAGNFNVNWVQNPKEGLNAYSSRMRFQINDNLVFKTDDQSASILVVKKEDYDSCSGSSPISKVQGGSFQLTRSGPYYFISGDAQKCMNGQKMMVVVLSPRSKKPVAAAPVISPISAMSPPATAPMAPSLTSPSMSPMASMAPSMTPAMAPSMTPSMTPSMAPSMTPSASMAPSSMMSPSSSMAPTPDTAGAMPGLMGSEPPAPAPAPKAESAGSALGAASVTIAIAIVGSVILA
uniref:Putative cold-regulated protein n=1 Tax=Allium sativum TaxID=4682 RepID=H2CLX4_ALLSA|nr:putative cold-regulated protein [Allium sativum]